jgi:hypothetical protein
VVDDPSVPWWGIRRAIVGVNGRGSWCVVWMPWPSDPPAEPVTQCVGVCLVFVVVLGNSRQTLPVLCVHDHLEPAGGGVGRRLRH